ncbi:hypothetical protein HY497_00540 [Candidatus Woesearchaeota archaeon]|nr:hypothetical protein [Candidatus Woesearchaeota archaeon]
MSPWTQAEVAAYQPRQSSYLMELYAIANLPPTDPEGRAWFLAEDVLNLTMTDHLLVMREAAQNGKHIGLGLLEDWAIGAREEQPQRNARTQSSTPKNI